MPCHTCTLQNPNIMFVAVSNPMHKISISTESVIACKKKKSKWGCGLVTFRCCFIFGVITLVRPQH